MTAATAPKDRPIIFSAPMIRALLEGRKSQTRRRIVTDQSLINFRPDGTPGKVAPNKRYNLGDRLWVRENHALVGGGDPGIPIYAANWREDARARGFDNIPDKPPRWTPSIHMPRWACRLTLIVTDVRVQRIQDISEDDAIAEGVQATAGGWFSAAEGHASATQRGAFALLWATINGPDAWTSNPWVVAVSFKTIRANIDAPEARAA